MDKLILKEQVEVIRQAFGYINQFKGCLFVIKIESTLIEHPVFPLLIRDVVLLHRMGINVILVPGARVRIDQVLHTYHIKCSSVAGVRVSPPDAIPLIKMAAFDVSNKIITMLAENGAHGVIGNWVRARGIGVRGGIDFQTPARGESAGRYPAQGGPRRPDSHYSHYRLERHGQAVQLFLERDRLRRERGDECVEAVLYPRPVRYHGRHL